MHSIVSYDGDLPEAFAPMSATVRLDDEIDLSRGDMLVSPESVLPHVSGSVRSGWLHETLVWAASYLVALAPATLRQNPAHSSSPSPSPRISMPLEHEHDRPRRKCLGCLRVQFEARSRFLGPVYAPVNT